MTVCPFAAWSGNLGGYYFARAVVAGESIGDNKGIPTNLYEFVVGQIIGVTLTRHSVY